MPITLSSASIEAEITEQGAELTRLRDDEGRDLLWDGDPAFWSGRSPLLFPIVGSLKDNRILIGGVEYTMPSHGFARMSAFSLTESTRSFCRLRLSSSEETRRLYPFAFELDVSYRIADMALTVTATATNSGPTVMPVSFGFHPAFRWPLPFGGERDKHLIEFEKEEPEPTRLLEGSLLGEPAPASPVKDRRLALRDKLFAKGALVFDKLASRAVTYGVPRRPRIKVSFLQMPHLGIWTKPGAGFVCIEPWQGHASPAAFDGELADKPGILKLRPGEARSFVMEITLLPA